MKTRKEIIELLDKKIRYWVVEVECLRQSKPFTEAVSYDSHTIIAMNILAAFERLKNDINAPDKKPKKAKKS